MSTQPGWYPDPHHPGSLRWFDGTQWTEHVSGAPALARPASSRSTTTVVVTVVVCVVGALIVLGVLAAIAIPVALDRGDRAEFASSVRDATCEQVAAEAVEISHRDLPAGYVALAAITDVHTVSDDRDTVQRPGRGEYAHVLTCEGTARWDDRSESRIRVALYVDSAGRHTISDVTRTT